MVTYTGIGWSVVLVTGCHGSRHCVWLVIIEVLIGLSDRSCPIL